MLKGDIMLELKNIKENKEYIKRARTLYNSAFPSAERVPFDILLFKARGSNVTFFAVVDGAEFKGLTYTVWYNDIVFIFYLAVEKQARGNGIGSQILTLIKNEFPACRLVLNIEALDDNAPNNAERIRRREFYVKNGFFGAGYNVREYSVVYENMCFGASDKPVTKEEYIALIKAYLGPVMYPLYERLSE